MRCQSLSISLLCFWGYSAQSQLNTVLGWAASKSLGQEYPGSQCPAHRHGVLRDVLTLPDFGFSPTAYAMYSDLREIGNEIPGHCVCTNNPASGYDYVGGDIFNCPNDDSHAATYIDGPSVAATPPSTPR
ncbi:uncharacterized protein I303_100040 [Kwoniella dejecticola CBS 10117]|uniref:Uncharacterized protein n=1 Tax=Kwoniella dejecticola CBS 10117 TaxID=1296121 RepID=A0A1A6ADW2_9TREE|nr:uncharacterized protein I303_00040 [Kwoniella dejecticola CBS 10117]OBR88229.1 hypothetical protein I303_00040 [Kwoniella dejecticola CBS 10117]